jgi:FOG: HEAT repeat
MDQAEIHRLASSQKIRERKKAIVVFGSEFSLLSNKTQAWQDLLSLTQDRDINLRSSAAETLGQVFHFMPDKTSACKDLFNLTFRDGTVRWKATYAIQSAFPSIPDKILAWKILISLVEDKDSGVRWHAIEALESVFPFMQDKDIAWQDLLSLVQSNDSGVRWRATGALKSVLDLIPDKTQAWQDLLGLTKDQNSDVRWRSVEALGSAFFQMPDKTKACQDLLDLSENEDDDIICGVAEILGSVFYLLPDKKQAWRILLGFSQHDDSRVRMYAYHSLGRASIHKATDASRKDELRKELEAAVRFFEISSHMQSLFNPARFCHPFYRSYLALTFQRSTKEEVQIYLSKAKEAVGSSESNELLKAVENLAKALQESQEIKEKPMDIIQSDLKAYQWYCDRASEHMIAAENKAPGAVKLLRKCNPFIEERIEATIADIQS